MPGRLIKAAVVSLAGASVAADRMLPSRWNKRVPITIGIDGLSTPNYAASVREAAIVWHPVKAAYYLIADVVATTNPQHPVTYDSNIHLWKCTSEDLATWTYIGVAIDKGGTVGLYGVASCAGAVYSGGKIYAPFSSRDSADFAIRSIGLAYSGSDPDVVPWTIVSTPIVNTVGEDDDVAMVQMPGDPRLHLYFRTTNIGDASGYKIGYSFSATPEVAASWATPVAVVGLRSGVTAAELTGAFRYKGSVNLVVMEQPAMVRAHWISANPAGPFELANAVAPTLTAQEELGLSPLYGGHLTYAIRDEEIRGAFITVTLSGSRYGLKGYAALNNKREQGFTTPGLLLVGSASGQTVATATWTKMTLSNAVSGAIDLDGWWFEAASRFIPKIAGYYEITANVAVLGALTQGASQQMEVRVNGSAAGSIHLSRYGNTAFQGFEMQGRSKPIYMNGDTDYLELYAYQDHAGNLTLGDNVNETWMSARLICPA